MPLKLLKHKLKSLRNSSHDRQLLNPRIKLYQKSANQGDAEAQFNLGLTYRDGQEVQQDNKMAAKWYQKAAEQGHITAQFSLGLLYQDGKGVRQNKTNAKEWYGRACDGGLQLGCDSYRELNEQGY